MTGTGRIRHAISSRVQSAWRGKQHPWTHPGYFAARRRVPTRGGSAGATSGSTGRSGGATLHDLRRHLQRHGRHAPRPAAQGGLADDGGATPTVPRLPVAGNRGRVWARRVHGGGVAAPCGGAPRGAALHGHLIEVGQGQTDEIRVKVRGGAVWQAMTLDVASRLWLGGLVSPAREGAAGAGLRLRGVARPPAVRGRARRLRQRGAIRLPGAGPHQPTAASPVGVAGGLPADPGRQELQGAAAGRGDTLGGRRHGGGGGARRNADRISLAYIERLNATLRTHRPVLVEADLWLVGYAYNVCWLHGSLVLQRHFGFRAVRCL